MARLRKFPRYIEFWTTEEHADAFDARAEGGLLSKSDLYRMAFDTFLRAQGAIASRARPNGQQRAGDHVGR